MGATSFLFILGLPEEGYSPTHILLTLTNKIASEEKDNRMPEMMSDEVLLLNPVRMGMDEYGGIPIWRGTYLVSSLPHTVLLNKIVHGVV